MTPVVFHGIRRLGNFKDPKVSSNRPPGANRDAGLERKSAYSRDRALETLYSNQRCFPNPLPFWVTTLVKDNGDVESLPANERPLDFQASVPNHSQQKPEALPPPGSNTMIR